MKKKKKIKFENSCLEYKEYIQSPIAYSSFEDYLNANVNFEENSSTEYKDYIQSIKEDPNAYSSFQDYLGANSMSICESCDNIVCYDEIDENGDCFDCQNEEGDVE